jgi:stringent starvation protein B
MGSPDRPSKHQAFLALLQEGRPSLHLDARREGVVVPEHLKADPHLVLQYGIDLPIPINDLVVDERGVRATLSFSRTPHGTFVPWAAVYVIATEDGRGVLFPEDVPSDVAIVPARSDGSPDSDIEPALGEGTGARLGASDGSAGATDDTLPGASHGAARLTGTGAPDPSDPGMGPGKGPGKGFGEELGGVADPAGAEALAAAAAGGAAPAAPRRTLRSIPLVALPDPSAEPDLDVEQMASSLAGTGGAAAVGTPRRRRKPQLRLVK